MKKIKLLKFFFLLKKNNLIEILHGSNHLIKHFLLIFINFNRFLLEKQHFKKQSYLFRWT